MEQNTDTLLPIGTTVCYESSHGNLIETEVLRHIQEGDKWYYGLACKSKADLTKVHRKTAQDSAITTHKVPGEDRLEDPEKFCREEDFGASIIQAYKHQFQSLREMAVHDAMVKVFLGGDGVLGGNQQKLAELHGAVLKAFPFLTGKPGVIYTPFQTTAKPAASKGSGHVIFLNPFLKSTFPCSLYWSTLDILVPAMAAGDPPGSIAISPIPQGSPKAPCSC